MQPIYFLLFLLVGGGFGGIIGYLWADRRRAGTEKDLEVSRLEGRLMELEGYSKGQNATLADFQLERSAVLRTREGLLVRRHFATFMERLVYRGIPLPWWTTRISIDENIDEKVLDAIVKSASVLTTALSGKTMNIAIDAVGKLLKKSAPGADPSASDAAASRDSKETLP